MGHLKQETPFGGGGRGAANLQHHKRQLTFLLKSPAKISIRPKTSVVSARVAQEMNNNGATRTVIERGGTDYHGGKKRGD